MAKHSKEKKQKSARRTKKKNILVDMFIYAILLALLIWGGFSLRDNYYTGHLDWQTAYSGALEDTIHASGLVVRQEAVLKAPAAGILRKAAEHGSRVTAGAVIAYIDAADGKSYELKAEKAGIVQFSVDGLENALSDTNFLNIDYGYLFSLLDKEKLQDTTIELTFGKTFKAGDTVGKIVDNLVDYHFVVYTDNSEAEVDYELKKMTVELPDGSTLTGKKEACGETKNGWYTILTLTSTADTELLPRFVPVTYTGSQMEGTIIPYSALVQNEDGTYKVFYRKKTFVAEKEVELLAYKDDLAVVSGIDAGTDVSAAPKYARVGAEAYID